MANSATSSAVGTLLDEDVLARRARLPRKPAPVTLTGSRVRLEPLDLDRDVAALHAVSDGRPAVLGERRVDAYDPDVLIWRYMSGGPFARAEDLAAWLRPQVEAPNVRCLVVVDVATERPIGVATYRRTCRST